MSSFHEDPTPRDLDAYLDGTLPEHARKTIAREIQRDRELRADVELQERIEASLRRAFLPPPLPAALLSQLRPTAPPRTFGRPRLGRRAVALSGALAAAVIVWGYIAWQFIPHTQRAVHRESDPQSHVLATVYQQRIDAGFKPDLAVADDKAFASTFASRHGQGLALRPLPAGSQVLGLAFSGGCSARTTSIMARVDNSPVMVFVDRLEADVHPELPEVCAGLRLYRKELGSLVAYELSPFDKPQVIDQLYTVGSPTPRMGAHP